MTIKDLKEIMDYNQHCEIYNTANNKFFYHGHVKKIPLYLLEKSIEHISAVYYNKNILSIGILY